MSQNVTTQTASEPSLRGKERTMWKPNRSGHHASKLYFQEEDGDQRGGPHKKDLELRRVVL